MIAESQLEEVLKECWARETSSDPDNWTRENPAWGQCAVTSLVVSDYLGGEIIWANVVLPDGRELSHYFNKISGLEKDFTRVQFPPGTQIPAGQPKTKTFPTTRDYILSFEKTRQRYETLKRKVEEFL